jgi:hypothetical protein
MDSELPERPFRIFQGGGRNSPSLSSFIQGQRRLDLEDMTSRLLKKELRGQTQIRNVCPLQS